MAMSVDKPSLASCPPSFPLTVLIWCWLRASRRRVLKSVAVLSLLSTLYLGLLVFVPDAWKDADLIHVVRVIADAQSFDLRQMDNPRHRREVLEAFYRDKPQYRSTRHDDAGLDLDLNLGLNIQGFMSQVEKRPEKDFYPLFFKVMRGLVNKSAENPLLAESAATLVHFQPILSQREKSLLLQAFDVFSHVCQEAGVTYFLLEASLMGVRRHHGMIPWDDDIDIVVNASQWKTLHVLLSAVPGFELYASSRAQWKFFSNASSSTSFPDKPFKFPYLDIFFFNEDDRFVWAVTQGLKHDLVHRKADIFPLRLCPFEDRLVPVPRNLPLLVDAAHDVEECVTGEYNHKTNQRFYYGGKVRVPCNILRLVYPFVSRRTNGDGSVTETLRIGTAVMGTFVYVP